MKRTIAALALLIAPLMASASVVYTATGGDYTFATPPYTTSMQITFQFATPTALAPNLLYGTYTGTVSSWSMNDGLYTLTNSTPGATLSLMLGTDATGAINNWRVEAYTSNFSNDMMILGPVDGPMSSASNGNASALNGTLATWNSSSSSVPEPDAAFLFLGGLTALGFGLRRKI